jgi:hypothetical protein
MSPCLRIAALALVVSFGLTSQAKAAGGSSVPLEDVGGQGVAAADGSYRYVTLRQGLKDGYETTLLKVNQEGGQVVRQRIIDDDFAVSAATFDSTPTGLSHDGSVLALIKPRRSYTRKTTELLILDAERLAGGAGRIVLDGDFSLDALSPDGETLYLIEHPDRRDFGAYQVRSFDIATQKLDPEPILDSDEEPDEMRGLPQTRETSPDGRWEYTLYDGGGGEPFIHALDVVEGATVCIDLPMIRRRDVYSSTLRIGDGSSLELVDRAGETRAIVNPETLEASEPEAEPEPAAARADEGEPGISMAGIAVGALVVTALAGLGIRRMRS